MHNRWTSLRVIHSASQWWCTVQSWGCRSGPVQDFCWHRSSCRWLLKHPAWGFQINVEQVLLLCTRKYTGGKCCHSVRNIFMFVIILSSLILCLVGVILIGSLQLQVDQLYFLTSISTHITNPVNLLIYHHDPDYCLLLTTAISFCCLQIKPLPTRQNKTCD